MDGLRSNESYFFYKNRCIMIMISIFISVIQPSYQTEKNVGILLIFIGFIMLKP